MYWRFETDGMIFACTLIWYHGHKQTHTGTNRLTHTHKYTLTPLVHITATLYCTE